MVGDGRTVLLVDEATLRRIVSEAVSEALAERSSGLRLLTPAEAAEILGVNERTVLRWAKAGKLPYRELSSKVLRFVESEILAAGVRGVRKAG